MLRFVLRRLLAGLVLLAVITTLAYWLMFLSSGNIARNLLGQYASAEQVALKASELGLDRPLPERYLGWLSGAASGDLGRSWFTSEPVSRSLATRLPVTLSLVAGTTLVAGVVATGLGVAAAVRRGWLDRVVQVLAVLGFALPGFWVAMVLVTTFAVDLGWFPATGYVTFADSPGGWLSTITLPVVSLALAALASTAQQVRSAVIDTLRQDFVRTLRSRGLPERRVILKHVLRNAGGPGLTVLALQFVGLLGGAVIVEQIFALPGLGQIAVSATTLGDIPVVMGVVVAMAVIVIVVNLVIDILHGWINPKVRLS